MDDAFAIQLQFPDGRAACRSEADEVEVIGAPGKMIMPIVLARMEERNRPARRGIERTHFIGLGTVTPLAG